MKAAKKTAVHKTKTAAKSNKTAPADMADMCAAAIPDPTAAISGIPAVVSE